MTPVISVENLSKSYRLGQIGTGTLTNDLKVWWAKSHGKSNLLLKVGQQDYGNRDGEEVWALRDVNFQVEQGEVLGIIGRNGAGKSTLLKILSRVTAPTSGQIKIKGRIASLLEVGTGFHPDLTGRENIYLNGAILGMKRREIDCKFDEIVNFAELERFIDTPVKRYSSGMYVRLAFAVAAHLEPEILVVDEVLAVGDAEFQKKCLGKIGDVAKEGRTVLFVSHNMAAIEKLCTKGNFINKGKCEANLTVHQAITKYLGNLSKQIHYYSNGPLNYVKVEQEKEILVISSQFTLDFDTKTPFFGFVISDEKGNRIFGSNPRISDSVITNTPVRKGKIIIEIVQPKLLNGTYRLSVWFGDSKTDFLVDIDCLEFEVINMAGLTQDHGYSNGSIFPSCRWILEKN